jgi:hypothetical protein
MTAFVGKMYLERGDAGSPTTYTRVCQIFGIGGLGQANALVDSTTFCSGGVNEYIGGLADGSEVTLNANFETGAAVLREMIQDVKDKTVRAYRLVADDEIDTPVVFYFDALSLSWQIGPSVDNKNTIDYGIKISGDITVNVEEV